MIKKIIIAVALFSSFGLGARYRSADYQAAIDARIDHTTYDVVMLYEESWQLRQDPEERKNIKQLRSMFNTVSSDHFYKQAGVVFIKSNIGKNALDDLIEKTGVKEFPAFVLYRNGMLFKDKAGNIPVLTGFVSAQELESFIDQHLKEYMEKYVAFKQERRGCNSCSGGYAYYGVGDAYYTYGYYYPYDYPFYIYGYPYSGVGILFYR